jgi:Flp pilus assembly protein TadG
LYILRDYIAFSPIYCLLARQGASRSHSRQLCPALLTGIVVEMMNKRESGQTLVEFALVLIFIILPLTLVFIEVSILLYEYVALTNAAREGARAGSIYLFVGDPGGSSAAPDAGRSATATEAVNATLGPLIPSPPDCAGTSSTTTCTIMYGASGAPIPDPLRSTEAMTVTVAHTHTLLFGAFGGEIGLQAHANMKIEPSTVISGTGP